MHNNSHIGETPVGDSQFCLPAALQRTGLSCLPAAGRSSSASTTASPHLLNSPIYGHVSSPSQSSSVRRWNLSGSNPLSDIHHRHNRSGGSSPLVDVHPLSTSSSASVPVEASGISNFSPTTKRLPSTKRQEDLGSPREDSLNLPPACWSKSQQTSEELDVSSADINTPRLVYRRLYDTLGPVHFAYPPLKNINCARGELRLWPREEDRVISQNSSRRKVHRAIWISPLDPGVAFPMALKFVEDGNVRDGRSIKREIECHLYIHQRLPVLMTGGDVFDKYEDAWPCAELIAYHLDKKNVGQSVLITRKLSGPDFFDVIRTEHNNTRVSAMYEYHKLRWCTLALKRVAQYARLGIRHNDIKPDNLVLDFYHHVETNERLLDVKLIDLGTASMHFAKDFTGGTSWYESPEQKLLEFHTKKHRNPEAARQVDIALPSDVWGAGLSITEVLMGRRVVDTLKPPNGPGPLEFRGYYSDDLSCNGWATDPADWVAAARRALGMEREVQKLPLCAEAARSIFDALVRPEADDRGSLADMICKIERWSEEAYLKLLRKGHDGSLLIRHGSRSSSSGLPGFRLQ